MGSYLWIYRGRILIRLVLGLKCGPARDWTVMLDAGFILRPCSDCAERLPPMSLCILAMHVALDGVVGGGAVKLDLCSLVPTGRL